jgi:4-amino-4-deoxy-L-arabinose transferase-like glycosyltransferase
VPSYWVVLLIAFVFAAFALTLLFTKRPWVDEAWNTGPALDLVTRGRLGTLLLDPKGSHLRLNKIDAVLQGINDRTYYIMPLQFLQLAAWGKLFGFSVFSMRMPSVFWGAIALVSVGSIVRRLYTGRGAALIAVAVLAVDFGFVKAAADARVDMTCAGLSFAALAIYLHFREANFLRAVVGAHMLTALATFAHPNGAFAAAALLLTMLWLDRGRMRLLTLLWVSAPYLLLGAFWAIFCMQAPADYLAQISASTAGRGSDIPAPWRGVWRELNGRFRNHFFPEGGAAGKLKIVGLLVYLAALGTLASARKLRRTSGCRLLLSLTLFELLCLSVFANNKNTYYIVNILPYFAAATGIAISYLWSSYGPPVRVLCTIALVAYGLVQTAAEANLGLITSGYRKEYMPVVSYLKSTLQPDDLVMGAAELGYALGFRNPQLVDDVWLGYWSGRRPTVVVVDRWYYGLVMEGAVARGIPTPGYFAEVLKNFRLVQDLKGYRIYRRVK